MTTLLLCNGAAPPRKLARRIARATDRLVVADGGANAALFLGLTPDIIIGDLDSISSAARRAFAGVRTHRIRRQDNTDMEKALDHIRAGGGGKVVVLGATGRRIDMTLANLSVVWRYIPPLDIVFADNGWFAVPLRGARTFTAKAGSRVSLIPFGICKGISLRGLRYPLKDARLGVGDVAVSNVVRAGRFSVAVERGRMLVVVFDEWHGDTR